MKMEKERKVFKLEGKVQHYAWGGADYIPRLLSVDNPGHQPFAEYWMGAHVNAPAILVGCEEDGAKVALSEYLKERPVERLGSYTAERFGRLPYLLKILDVKDMLSIQVHPSKKAAELEFAAENQRGVALNAPVRNYKDDNHKPELMAALSEFWLLHGFKPEQDLIRILAGTPELNFLTPVFSVGGYQLLYKTVMEMPQAEVDEVLQPLLNRILPLYRSGGLVRSEEHFWAARAALTFNKGRRIDRGIFSIYFFNLLNLHPGEAIFQDAGLPHAYLEGQNVEIMANSDNVLRGGLTPKHVDVPELMKHVRFEETQPRILMGDRDAGHITVYGTPAPDFELSRISLQAGEAVTVKAHAPEIYIVMDGRLGVLENGTGFSRKKGDSFVAIYCARFELKATADAVLYRAAVPVRSGYGPVRGGHGRDAEAGTR
ncbi:MAG TPA: mannose-6-phosphate isomerase, class I [Puia sp.]|jgi:mannose-6-phosphate isomerase|nr:mannose-6-phosphate isomerase, class I [Puia sp.]